MFYIKSLAVYAILIAFLYCPSMQYEHKYDEHSVESVSEQSSNVVARLGADGKVATYPCSKMMNLIEQCRPIESKFRSVMVEFAQDPEEKMSDVAALLSETLKVAQRLREEKVCFTTYIEGARTQHRDSDSVNYTCSQGKCNYKINDEAALYGDKAAKSTNERLRKSTRYMSQVLKNHIHRMESISRKLRSKLEVLGP